LLRSRFWQAAIGLHLRDLEVVNAGTTNDEDQIRNDQGNLRNPDNLRSGTFFVSLLETL
jgi:hypothetical protein